MTIEQYKESVYPLLKELCKIPAPSGLEDKRAEFCKKYLENAGYDNVYIDDAKNVICGIGYENSSEITVFAAHTDTVFPDLEPMPFSEDGNIARCPGICDDTACLAALLVAAKYFKDNNTSSNKGVLFVCNSCEEGLGNLKGTRALMEEYKGRVARFITFDGLMDRIVIKCVGSHRYNVEVKTEGGHSFNAFGNENAISHLSNIINKIYEIEVPVIGDSKTTYNVGTISGGTSVNTIAQSASMLCEYRSDDVRCLEIMQKKFEEIFDSERSDKVEVKVTKVGDRPCAKGVDESEFAALLGNCKGIIEKITEKEVRLNSGSTDCNIPASLGVPSVCVGNVLGGGMHTREEWMEIDSLDKGFDITIELIKAYI